MDRNFCSLEYIYDVYWVCNVLEKHFLSHKKCEKKKIFFVKNSTVQEKSVYLTWYNKKMYIIYICVWLFGFTWIQPLLRVTHKHVWCTPSHLI